MTEQPTSTAKRNCDGQPSLAPATCYASPSKVQYDRSRYPKQPEKKKCRGCHSDVPKGRSSWCSNKCYDTYEPRRVRWFCQERDKFICYHCGVDAERMRKRYEHACKWEMPSQYSYFRDGVFQREQYDRAVKISLRHERRWREAAKKRITTMRTAGWPNHACRDCMIGRLINQDKCPGMLGLTKQVRNNWFL